MGCVRTVIVSPAGPTCQPLSKFSKTPAEIGIEPATRQSDQLPCNLPRCECTCAKFWYFPSVVVLYLYFLSKRSDSIGDRTAHPLLDMITAYHFSKCCFVLRIGNKLFYIINVIWPSVEEQIYMVDLSLLIWNLKFITGITLSYELQIWWFFFLFSSKIMNFHFVLFVCILISISWNLYIWLVFYHPRKETKMCFCIEISDVTLYFLIL